MPKYSSKGHNQVTMPMTGSEDVFSTLIEQVSNTLDADIVFLNADLERGLDRQFIDGIRKKRQHQNLMLILVTSGGDADVAYRIARCAQDNYEKFIVFVSGYCKSAGTLCVLGSHEIIMCNQGELGPLDVQLYKKDDLGEMNSGLVIEEALYSLQHKTFTMFEQNMMAIKNKSRGQISFKLATEIATKMIVGLFEPIFRQIDPVMIGDIGRSMSIAKEYGTRLNLESKNLRENSLRTLVNTYPSHEFVIDRREAEKLFINIRGPTIEEEVLAQMLEPESRFPVHGENILVFLSYKQHNSKETRNGKGVSTESVTGDDNDKRSSGSKNNRGNTRGTKTPKPSTFGKKTKSSS